MRRMLLLLVPMLVVAGVAYAESMPTDQWLDAVKPLMPQTVCKDGQPALKCFKVTQAECTTAVLKLSEPCVKELRPQMPKEIKSDDASAWGTKLGVCVGKAYGAQFASKRVSAPGCN